MRVKYRLETDLWLRKLCTGVDWDQLLEPRNYHLYPHQQRALDFLVQDGGNVILNVPMGLGKTLIILAYVLHHLQLHQVLFITTPTIYHQIDQDLKRFFPRTGHRVLLVNRKSFTKSTKMVYYDAIIIDEVHEIRRGTAIYGKIESIQCQRVFGLSGTLVSLEDSVKLCHGATVYSNGSGVEHLPVVHHVPIWIRVQPYEEYVYGGYRARLQRMVSSSTNMLRVMGDLKHLRQYLAVAPSKLRCVRYMLKNLISRTEKVVIFDTYNSTLLTIVTELSEPSLQLFGSLAGTVQQREHVLSKFRTGVCRVLLCSVDLCGTGIDLSCAHHVIIMSPCDRGVAHRQVTARVNRLNDERKSEYTLWYMLMEDTIESSMYNDNIETPDMVLQRLVVHP
jgi:superfamily II DNA or RNA helicase